MARPKKYNNPKTVSFTLDGDLYLEVRQKVVNVSAWINEKMEELVKIGEREEEIEQKLIKAKNEKEEAETKAQHKEKEIQHLSLQLEAIQNPATVILEAQEISLDKALTIIEKRLSDPIKALELAEEWSNILKKRGIRKSKEELLKLTQERRQKINSPYR